MISDRWLYYNCKKSKCSTINRMIQLTETTNWTYYFRSRVRISIRARCTTLCDKVCQWLATGWWFSPGPPVSSTNKTDSHVIAEILLKVVLNTIKSNQSVLFLRFLFWFWHCSDGVKLFVFHFRQSVVMCIILSLIC
jgi:hypothetical protein